MAFKLFCLYLAVTCVFAAPPTDVVPLEKQQPTVIPIISQSEELEANGTFKFSYETANGIKREETSYDKVLPKVKTGLSSNEGGEESDESNDIHVQQGSYSYTAPDGTLISVKYIADENGFRLIGDHLPKAPSAVSSSSIGRRAKTIAQDNAEVASAPAPAVAAKPTPTENSEIPKAPEASLAPETPQVPEKPKSPEAHEEAKESEAAEAPKASQLPISPAIESRVGEDGTEQASTTEETSEPSTSEASSELSTTPETSTTEAASTIVPVSSTTEQATEVTSTVAPNQSTTTESASTPESYSELTTLETSSETAATLASEPSTPGEPVSVPVDEPSTPAVSTPANSDVTTEEATSLSA